MGKDQKTKKHTWNAEKVMKTTFGCKDMIKKYRLKIMMGIFILLAVVICALPVLSAPYEDNGNDILTIRVYNLMEFSAVGCIPWLSMVILPLICFGCLSKEHKELTLLILLIVTLVCYMEGIYTACEWLGLGNMGHIFYEFGLLFYPVSFVSAVLNEWNWNKKSFN